MHTLAKEVRWTDDIAMWTIDRPIPESCVHRTAFCDANCYNVKLYAMYPNMRTKDARNEAAWLDNDAVSLRRSLERRTKHKGIKRLRLMSRGETFRDRADLDRVRNLATVLFDWELWIPTRAWRSPLLLVSILELAAEFPNIRLLASMDPTNTADDWAMVKAYGMSTMFFGDDAMAETPNGDRVFNCPKTHRKLSGHCAICKGGCFRTSRRVDVHLSQH